MKLQRVYAAAVAEALAGCPLRRCERDRARGHLEDIAVPVKRSDGGSYPAPQTVLLGGVGQGHRVPSDFLARGVASDFRAQRGCDDLSAKTDTEHREVVLDGVLDQLHLIAQKWILFGLIDGHGTAHYD